MISEFSSIVKVVILGAGQGKRLLPLTAEVPKALLDIGGRSLIGRQIDAFATCGVTEFVVVTGYGAERMEEALSQIAREKRISHQDDFQSLLRRRRQSRQLLDGAS